MQSLEDLYARVRAHLLAQGYRSTDTLGNNRLWADGGQGACAIGCLHECPESPDLREHLEGAALQLVAKTAEDLAAHGVPGVRTVALLEALQNVHDNVDPARWATALDQVAVIHEVSHATR